MDLSLKLLSIFALIVAAAYFAISGNLSSRFSPSQTDSNGRER